MEKLNQRLFPIFSTARSRFRTESALSTTNTTIEDQKMEKLNQRLFPIFSTARSKFRTGSALSTTNTIIEDQSYCLQFAPYKASTSEPDMDRASTSQGKQSNKRFRVTGGAVTVEEQSNKRFRVTGGAVTVEEQSNKRFRVTDGAVTVEVQSNKQFRVTGGAVTVEEQSNKRPRVTGGAVTVEEQSNKRPRVTGGAVEVKEVVEVILNSGTAPPELIFNSYLWIQNCRLRLLRPRNRVVGCALRYVKYKINGWSVRDLFNHFSINTPLFETNHQDKIRDKYYTISVSIDIIFKLLYFQFKSISLIKDFLRTCYNVCNRDNRGKNTIFIEGGSDAASFFLDALTLYFLNRGNVRSPSKIGRFSFQDCINRRVILWDKAKIDPGNIGTIKRILTGHDASVGVKCKGDSLVQRTPVFISSDKNIFSRNSVFENRIHTYRWLKFPLWSDYEYEKQLNPMAVGMLLLWAGDESGINFGHIRRSYVRIAQEGNNLGYTYK